MKRMRRFALAIAAAAAAAAFAVLPARAEVEKIMLVCDGKLCPLFRASFAPPPGWVEDKENGQRLRLVIFVPKNQTFRSAGAIIYATARSNPDKAPVAEFVDKDHARWRERAPDVKIKRLADVARTSGKDAFQHHQFEAPSMKAQAFERVATVGDSDQDGNAFVVGLVLTAKSARALSAAEPAYLAMLKAY
jgi:hypothetical protein